MVVFRSLMARPGRRHVLSGAACALACLLAQGCATEALWSQPGNSRLQIEKRDAELEGTQVFFSQGAEGIVRTAVLAVPYRLVEAGEDGREWQVLRPGGGVIEVKVLGPEAERLAAEIAPALRKLAARGGAECEVRLTVLSDGREEPRPPLCREIQISVKTNAEAPQKEGRYDSPVFAGSVRILGSGYRPAGRPLAGGAIAIHYSEEIIVDETFDSSLIWKIIGTPFTLALDAVCVGGIFFLELGRLDVHIK